MFDDFHNWKNISKSFCKNLVGTHSDIDGIIWKPVKWRLNILSDNRSCPSVWLTTGIPLIIKFGEGSRLRW